nr:MAG: hypothetical protein [Heterobasidion ambi-like virus 13]
MPSINTLYLATQKTSDAPTLTIFKERGLENYIPSTILALEIYGKPAPKTNLSMAIYTDNFPAALRAYQTQTGVVGLGAACHTKLSQTLDPTFMPFPKIIATHEHKDRAEAEKFFADSGFTKIQNKTYATFIGIPSMEFLSNATKYSVNLDTRTDRGITNIIGFSAFSVLSKLVKVFLTIHNEVVKEADPVGIVNSHPSTMDLGDEKTMWGEKIVASFMGAVNGDEFPLEADDRDWIGFQESINLKPDSVYGVMRPVATSEIARYYGPTSACPFKQGIVVPYFPDLIIPDSKAALAMFQRYFYGILGNTEEHCITAMGKFRRGFAFLSGTDIGIALTHMMKCIELALECRCGIYVVLEKGRYHGSVLGGEGFMVANKGRVLRPVGGTTFSDSLLDITGHDHALTKLCKLLSVLPLKGEETKVEKIQPKDMKSSMAVNREVSRRQWKKLMGKDDDEREDVGTEIYELLDKISFDANYLIPSIENILRAAEIIAAGESRTWPDGTPIYLRGAVWEDHITSTLAVFGHIAPSMMATKGDMMNFAKSDKEEEDPALKEHAKIKGVKAMRYVAVHMKSLAQASKDWKEMMEAGAVRYQTGVKGGPVKCSFSYIGDKRNAFWYPLSKTILAAAGEKPKIGKKRKVDDDDEETKTKKLKLAQDFLDDLF